MVKTKKTRTPFIAGNWKCNNTIGEARSLIGSLVPLVKGISDVDIVVCPPFTALDAAFHAISGANIALGAQNCFWESKGAWTSQLSPEMLLDAGCKYAIVGHSETRGRFGTVDETLESRLGYFGETDATINAKAHFMMGKGLTPIICCGEMISERQQGNTDSIVSGQIKACLAGMTAEQVASLVIAYEPVWAIGTGEVCQTDEANRVCGLIRQTVREMVGADAAEKVRILYGGSMNDKNAEELLEQTDIDGGLVGGASLKADAFATIVKAASYSG